MIRHAGSVIGLVVVWVLLWEEPTVANLASGVAATAIVLAVGRSGLPLAPFRPFAVLHLLGWFVVALVKASLVVAWEVVTPGTSINEGIVAVPLGRRSDALVTLVANAISLTPGTLTIEVDPGDDTVLYVHVLHLRSIEAVRRDVARLDELAVRAFGRGEEVAA